MSLRFRGRRQLEETVQNFDVFPKVQEKVKEKGRVYGAIVTIIFATCAIYLIYNEIKAYNDGALDYRYNVDVDLTDNARMHVDVDLVIAMPCSLLDTEISGAIPPEDAKRKMPIQSPFEIFFHAEQTVRLKLTPTRFDLSAEELPLWQELQQAQRLVQSPGKRYMRSLADVAYIHDSILSGLHDASERKQHDEVARLKQRGVNVDDSDKVNRPFGQMIMMGGGVVQVMHFGSGINANPFRMNDARDDSDACHISGIVPVKKAKGHVKIVAGRQVDMGFMRGRMEIDSAKINFTHRIEHFGFGPRIPGLVVPLAGTERYTNDHLSEFAYFAKIVPTRLRTGVASTLSTYQYSVTQLHRRISHTEGNHGEPAIKIQYDVTPLMIDIGVSEQYTLTNTIIRLCAAVGGLFATTVAVMGWVNALLGLVLKKAKNDDDGYVIVKN